ncbi:MAG TPA: DUF3592 domain-containing protein [Bryobacteraceae bacterium]|jgi:hypothetical protein
MALPRAWLYFWYACGVAGLALLAWAAIDWQRANSFLKIALEGRGMIVGVQEENVGRGRIRYFPEIEFKAVDSRAHRFRSDNWTPWPPHVGDSVMVLYDPVTPARARVDEADDRVLLRMLIAGMGLCLTLIGLSPLVFRKLRN